MVNKKDFKNTDKTRANLEWKIISLISLLIFLIHD